MIPFRSGAVLPFVAASCLIALSACHTPATPRGQGVQSRGLEKLLEKNPIDVAVAPVHSAAGKSVPARELRACFQQGLVTRYYSPLSNEFVDRNVVDASYTPGASNEQAVLLIDVERWDTSLWQSHNAITVKMQVRLVDAAGGGANELWSSRVDRRFDFGSAVEHMATETARLHHACSTIAAEVLEALPARNPKLRP